MKRNVVRYKTDPARIEENKRLIEQVFAELNAKSPEGVRYAALALDDGTFVHIVETEDGAATPIPSLDAFRAFQSGIEDRCVEKPVAGAAAIVGNYRMFG